MRHLLVAVTVSLGAAVLGFSPVPTVSALPPEFSDSLVAAVSTPTAVEELPGGRVVVLDFFQPESAPSRVVQASYNKLIVPVVGGLITGFGDAYRYLAGSIDAFCTRREFEELMRSEGLNATSWDVFPPVASIVVGEAPRGGGDV